MEADFLGEKELKNVRHPVKVYALRESSSDPTKKPIPKSKKIAGSKRRKIKTYLVAATLLTFLTLLTLYTIHRINQKSSHKLNEDLIAVANFENQTGDESLDPVGKMVSDWITQGIANTEILTIVPSYSFESGENIHQNMEAIRELAEEIGTKTIVTGIFYKQGNQLQFHTHIVDAENEKIVSVIDPVSGPAEDPMMAIDRIKQEVMGSLISIFDPFYSLFAENLNPPSFEAYKEMMTGMDYFLKYNWEKATPYFYKAAEIDSTYIPALIMALQSHSNYGREYDLISECEKADSLYHVILKQTNRMTKREMTTVNFMYAELHGDNETYYKNVKIMASSNYITNYELGWAALITNRLEECISVLKSLNPEFKTLEGWYWRMYTTAHHLTGRANQELNVAKECREYDPNNLSSLYFEVRAYISNANIDQIDDLTEECYNLPETSYWNPAIFMYNVAIELRIHGYAEKSKEICSKALKWCKEDDEDHDDWMARLYYISDDWDNAQELFEKLYIENPGDAYYMGFLGVIAAKKGDEEKKSEYVRVLEDVNPKYLNGKTYMWRARIAAASGNKEEAVKMIRDAIADGFFFHQIHYAVEFVTLQDYPPFQELMKPKEFSD